MIDIEEKNDFKAKEFFILEMFLFALIHTELKILQILNKSTVSEWPQSPLIHFGNSFCS